MCPGGGDKGEAMGVWGVGGERAGGLGGGRGKVHWRPGSGTGALGGWESANVQLERSASVVRAPASVNTEVLGVLSSQHHCRLAQQRQQHPMGPTRHQVTRPALACVLPITGPLLLFCPRRRTDWKKAYVLFKPPPGSDIEREYLQQRALQQQDQLRNLEELKAAALARRQLPELPPAAAAAVARAVAPTVLQNANRAIRRAAERKAQAKQAWKQGVQEQQQHKAEQQGAPSRPRSRSSKPTGKRS